MTHDTGATAPEKNTLRGNYMSKSPPLFLDFERFLVGAKGSSSSEGRGFLTTVFFSNSTSMVILSDAVSWTFWIQSLYPSRTSRKV